MGMKRNKEGGEFLEDFKRGGDASEKFELANKELQYTILSSKKNETESKVFIQDHLCSTCAYANPLACQKVADIFINSPGEVNSEDENEEEKFYLYDNFGFLTEVIGELIKLNQDKYSILGDLMNISRKLIKQINIRNYEYLNIIDGFVDCFKRIKADETKMAELNNYFEKYEGKKPLDSINFKNK